MILQTKGTQLMDNDMLEEAIYLAANAHHGVTDKGGKLYLLHPLRVMFKFHDVILQIIAVLHDVVEDSEVTLEELSEMGFDPIIVSAIDSLSRREGESYKDYIVRLSKNPNAVKVKLADLEDNLNILRLGELSDKDIARLNKYKLAYKLLTDLDSGVICSL